ncbi:MAG: hypothetical protein DMG68_21585, partial [Acidobacteria bacterium]
AQATAIQLHVYGRQLQNQGHQAEAFAIFRVNAQRNPSHWLVHSELARMSSAKGDFTSAAKEMQLAADGAPDNAKPAMQGLVKRLQANEDINK